MTIDVLAIGAHPDDIDLIAGGTLAKLTDAGRRVVAVDLTRGETGTRGTPVQRRKEALASAKVLGFSERIGLDMGDAVLDNTLANRRQLVELIRSFRPVLVMTHHWDDLHPDHACAGRMLRDIMHPLGMINFPAAGRPYRPNEVLFFMGHFPFEPSFVVDVSDHFQQKLTAVREFKSQLSDPEVQGLETNISQPDFLSKVEARARHYGSLILRTYGEPFAARRPVPVADPVELYAPFGKL